MVTKLFVPERRIVVPKPPSYLKLDMAFAIGAGTKLMDKSRYRSHGTIHGADWATGAHGKCLDFVSANKDYVEIPASHTQLDFTSDKFSMVVRVKMETLTANGTIIARGALNIDGYYWIVTSTGDIVIYTSQSGKFQASYAGNGTVVSATWHTLGISRDGASIKLYKNGVDVTTTSGTHIDPATCARTALIGILYKPATYLLDGPIEFFRIFGGIALPASSHLAWHNALA